MDSFLAQNKLKCISNSSDITTTKHELLKFIDGVLGVYDSAISGVDNLVTAINSTLDITPYFKDVKFPKFKVAKEDAEKIKDKLSNKYNVEEQYITDFIDKGKLPDNGESSYSPY